MRPLFLLLALFATPAFADSDASWDQYRADDSTACLALVTDPGEPTKCPVWQFHQVYTDEPTREWVQQGCRTAGIGCLECKQPVIDAVIAEQAPFHERAQQYLDDPALVRSVLGDGCERARKMAQETMRDVRDSMGLSYS